MSYLFSNTMENASSKTVSVNLKKLKELRDNFTFLHKNSRKGSVFAFMYIVILLAYCKVIWTVSLIFNFMYMYIILE